MKRETGLVYVFFGNGKGKTSAALGVALRSLLVGRKVVWISWYKESSWQTAEMGLPEKFGNNLEMFWTGKGFFGGPRDRALESDHRLAAKEALSLAEKKITGSNADLVILDEVLKAVDDGLLGQDDVLRLIRNRGTVNIVLTGHVCPKKIIDEVDLVTEMNKIKHPFDRGVLAVRGLDF